MNKVAVLTVLLALSFSFNSSLGTWIIIGRHTTASTFQRLSASGTVLVAVFSAIMLVVQAYR